METIDKNTIVNQAGKAGAVFGTISGAWIFLSIWMAGNPIAAKISVLLDLAKTVGLVFLMIFFMKKLVADYSGVTNRETRSFGRWTVLFSALITAIATFIAYEFAFPDYAATTMDGVWQMLGSSLDSNSRSMLESYENNFSVITSISGFAWCVLYGLVLSRIVSANVPKDDPFSNFKDIQTPDEQ